jgi:hypothetical protein
VEDGLGIHVAVSETHDFVVKGSKLDVTVTLLLDGVQRPHLVLSSVPVHLEMFRLALGAQLLVQSVNDLLVRAPWNGILSPWSLKPRSRSKTTRRRGDMSA